MILKTIYKFNLKENWLEFLSHSFSAHERGNLLQEVGHFLRKKYMFLLSANRIALEKKKKLLEPLKMMLKDEPIERAKIRFAAVAQ